ncbi:GAF sensor signal transduction histidine kinase [Pseudarthrobacter chlorophenolicus A6]|uniref:Sensor-like histidine kinase SenX3 n=1 Tax=Pseudarthrobacter chlorophenolicus (strain ATCC 700700 / DSM 12829 / CIP 107037 / JCM 12360 / KCTC 9906 / NCIMB 13794 / A6) TaxID=452863 RepID=B8H8Z9_PSECP|nr:GAF domain-containing sensor histidine kinase [Pseudarthrobacter chlorophenolicus]ACL38158.1 GAF sensor signal transduction histidine kinase [Pseudarthrobacter chlorophenolicus A6]SDQ54273.1 Signal transduction histidine kinase [Pseudarthrobacter chlorophenolicus]
MSVDALVRDAVLARTGLPTPGPDGKLAVPAPSERLQNLVELARTVCQQPVTAINIITADLQYQVAAVGMEPYLCSREDSMCAVSFLGGRPTVVEDASLDPRYSGNPYVDGRRGAVRFYASIPLVAEDGFVLGTLCAGAREPGRLSDRQRHGLEILAAEIVDVLHLERRARQLSDALGEARRANALLAEFAGRISHDLRNPLTSVLGYVELGQMSDGAASDPDLAGYLEVAAGSGQRMLSMIEDVLSYATTGGDLRPARVSLKDLVQDVVQDLAASLEVSGAAVDAGDLIFTADAGQMRVLLQNLIHNAVTYSRPGIAPVVRVTGHVSEGGVTLRVIDNGKGISEPDRDRVLDPLVRLHRDGDPPGTGLGLATCARIASAAGGRLEIGPVPGEGTMISIHLQQES